MRHGALFDGEDGLARVAVQNIEKAGLVTLDDDGDIFAVEAQRREQRRCSAVEIPKIVMDDLKSPDEFAGFAAESDDRVGPLVVAGAQAAVVIGAGASCGNEEQVALLVDNHDGPGVASAAAPGRSLAFGSGSGRICGKRVPAPSKSAGAGVISPHDATSHVRAMIVVNGGADDDQIVNNGGRRSHVIPTGVVLEDIAEADLTFLAEICAGCASSGIDSDKAGVLRGLEDATMARFVFGARAVEPGSNAAVDEAVAIVAIKINFGVVSPELLSGFGVESDDAVEGGGQVESAVYQKRSGLEAAALSSTPGLGNVAGVESPGDFELGDILAVDLGKRGEAHAARVVAVVRPGISGNAGWGRHGSPSKDCTGHKRCSRVEKLRAIVHS